MNFIRKYSAFLLPAGIVLAAVVFIALTVRAGKGLSKDMDTSVKAGGRIQRMKEVPSGRQADVERIYQDKHKADADMIERLAKQSTQRELLSYMIFPKPRWQSEAPFIEFGGNFCSAIENMINGINGRDAPSESDIRKAAGGAPLSGSGGKYASASVAWQTKKATGPANAMVDAVCEKRAREISIYANPNSFAWYVFWKDYEYTDAVKALDDCWYSQLAYWIYEDVIETVKSMNTGSGSVYTSPVKRLSSISFASSGKSKGSAGSTGRYAAAAENTGDRPQYIMDDESPGVGAGQSGRKAAGAFAVEPWTLRKCDDNIDVVHFDVALIVSAKSVMPFMKELCSEKEHTFRKDYMQTAPQQSSKHNQITILKSEITPIDRPADEQKNYRYGDGAAVNLNLVCEYIFNRSGYDKIKPESIKASLQQLEVDPDTGRAGSGDRDNSRKRKRGLSRVRPTEKFDLLE